MKHHPLPKPEYYTYLLLSLGIHFYLFYKVYLSSKDYEEIIEEQVGLERDVSFWGLKKDVTDFEWSFWMDWARSKLFWLMLGHSLLSKFSQLFFRKYHRWTLMVYGMVACLLVLGTKGLAAVFMTTTIFYIVAQMRHPLITWLSSLFTLLLLHNESVENIQRAWYGSENEFYLLQFTLTVRSLFYISYCLDYSSSRASDKTFSFTSLMSYVFYYPLFHNGPIITYNDFTKQMSDKGTRWTHFTFLGLLTDACRLVLWWFLAELMIHIMYIHAMFSNYDILEGASYWTLGGLALAQVLFFYVKYLVLYGFPVLIVQLDGLEAPKLPRCVSTMYSFTSIWRCFDVGLHRFLVRYVYIPMGGSHAGLGRMLLSTASTFIFISYWHGGHEYLWYWAALNCFGITAEYGLKSLLTLPFLQENIEQNLSPKMYRHLHAALASLSSALLILTNLVFLGGEKAGKIYWDRLFVQGWPWIPLVMFGCLYCFAQVGIEWSLFLYPKYRGKFPLCFS